MAGIPLGYYNYEKREKRHGKRTSHTGRVPYIDVRGR